MFSGHPVEACREGVIGYKEADRRVGGRRLLPASVYVSKMWMEKMEKVWVGRARVDNMSTRC